jgi:hypothetical protein
VAVEVLKLETLDANGIARLFAGVPEWRRGGGGNGALHRSPMRVEDTAVA